MSRHAEPRTQKARDALAMLRAGLHPKAVALRTGQTPATVEVLWLRYVVLPEWKEFKAGRANARRVPV